MTSSGVVGLGRLEDDAWSIGEASMLRVPASEGEAMTAPEESVAVSGISGPTSRVMGGFAGSTAQKLGCPCQSPISE